MGNLIISTQVTLDGVMEVGEWFSSRGEHDWHGATGAASHDQLRATEAMLLGRKNYEGLARGLAHDDRRRRLRRSRQLHALVRCIEDFAGATLLERNAPRRRYARQCRGSKGAHFREPSFLWMW